jgi:hypothetical protein
MPTGKSRSAWRARPNRGPAFALLPGLARIGIAEREPLHCGRFILKAVVASV